MTDQPVMQDRFLAVRHFFVVCITFVLLFIMTAMTDALSEEVKAEWCKKIPLRRGGTPEDVANIATFLASDMSSYVSGQVIQVDGGMNM